MRALFCGALNRHLIQDTTTSMKRILIVITALILCACSARAPLEPQSQLRIVRDTYGVPHIYADDIYGLYYGYGYAVAQDRLFQMEMTRRSTQGTVAAVLGAEYLDYDKGTRQRFSTGHLSTGNWIRLQPRIWMSFPVSQTA